MQIKKILQLLVLLIVLLTSVMAEAEATSFKNPINWDSLEHHLKVAPKDTAFVDYMNAMLSYLYTTGSKNVLPLAQEALRVSDSLGYKKGSALSTLHVAMINDMHGNYDKALEYYHKALNLAEEIHSKSYYSQGLLSLGYFYCTQGNFEKAIEFTRKSADLEKEEYGEWGASYAWSNLGFYFAQVNDFDSAMYYTLKAYEVFKSDKDSAGLGDVYFNLGTIAWKADTNYFKALNYCLHAQDMYLGSEYTELETIAECKATIGKLYIELRNYNMASYYLDQTLEIAKKNNFRSIIKSCYQYKADLYAAIGNFSKAYDYHKLFFQMHDSIYNARSAIAIKHLQNQHELATQQAKIALLHKDKIIQQDEIKRQTIIRNSFIGLFCFFLVVATYLFRNNEQKRKINKLLTQQKEQIEEKNIAILKQNKLLQQQKRDIITQSSYLHKANLQISRQKELIEQKNKDITSSLNYARRIQDAMLPQPEQIKAVLPDAFTWLCPREIVSGDFYWMGVKDNKTFLAAVDCTGHGVPGAFMSLIGETYLNQIVISEGITEPSLILEKLNSYVKAALNQETTQNQDGMEVALCVIDYEEKEVRFSGAKNGMYVVQNGQLNYYKGDRANIGGIERLNHGGFTEQRISFKKPTAFYLTTDGIKDQFGGAKDKKFGESQLRKLLFEIHNEPMEKQVTLVKERIMKWMEGYEQIDDMLLIGWRL